MLMNKDNNDAEKLFKKFTGSFFSMDRAGELEKYKGFHVDASIEKKWFDEMIDEELKALMQNSQKKIPFVNLCLYAQNVKDIGLLDTLCEKLTTIIDEVDVFDRLVMTENFIETLRLFKFKKYDISKYKNRVDYIVDELKNYAVHSEIKNKLAYIEKTFDSLYRS